MPRSRTATGRLRWILWVAAVAIAVGCAAGYGQVTLAHDAAGWARAALAVGLGLAGIASVFLWPDWQGRKAAFAIVVPAVLVRLAILPAATSDDVFRYLWEGKLMASGGSPYAQTADDASVAAYRDEYWVQMNHRDQPTAYPPLAMWTFSQINRLGYATGAYQVVFAMADVGLVLLLIAMARRLGRPVRWVAFYGLSPLSVIAFAGEAHYDVLMVLPLVAAVFFSLGQRGVVVAGALLAVAVHVKLMVAVCVPMLLWGRGVRGWVTFAAVMLALTVPYFSEWRAILEAVWLFGATRSFNGPIYQVAAWILPGRVAANVLVALVFAMIWGRAFWLVVKGVAVRWQMAGLVLMSLVILAPTVHFWYLVWVLPWVALQPRASWLSLSLTGSVYFLVWTQASEGWGLPLWARVAFWAPFFVLIVWEYLGRRSFFARRRTDASGGEISVSVVIPTYRPGAHLAAALASIRGQTATVDEIIVVDAGGLELPDADDVRLLTCDKGRGLQIKTGVEAATSEWVVILHADVVLPTNAVAQLRRAVAANKDVVGGGYGQRFDHGSSGLMVVEMLNEARATLSATYFGDQTQYSHRETALREKCLSDQRLMEDIELSDRLRKQGTLLYLSDEPVVSAEKWRRNPFWKRFGLVVDFFFRYRLKFWKSADERKALAKELAQRY